MRFLPLILKNSLRNRRRSFLTISSLAISLCLLGVLMALYYALFFSPPKADQALRLITRHKVSITMVMPLHYRDKIRNVPGVREIVTWQWFGGLYKNEQREQKYFFPRFGVEARRMFDVYRNFVIPEDQKQAFISDRRACIVSRATAEAQGFKIGDRVYIKGNIFPIDLDLTVKGIYDMDDGNEGLWFHMEQIEEGLKRLGSNRSFAGTFTILANSAEDVPRIQRAVDEMFANSDAPTRTETEQAFALSFLAFLGNLKLILMSICAAVTFTILLVAANTVAMSVRERVREVGVLKTLGFTQQKILGLLLGEALAISLLGGALGLLMAQGLCRVLAVGMATFMPPDQLTIRLPVFLALLGISLLIGIASSAVPAWNASRTPILDALRVTD
ncbi:MAG: ABC transporter permease [Bryobacteraceae bacterium]|jgi:putative ABC transport system permease protein|nr:ABC transporter permease [Solibacteraceae bacterium]MCO5353201.1 ABC transporter permease [Bryobacteraceae bacterium]